MATPKGYSSYRGRTPGWKVLVAILLGLVILVAAGFLLLQEHLVYDDSGLPRLELPWGDDPAASSSQQGDVSVGDSSQEEPPELPDITIEKTELPPVAALLLSQDPATWEVQRAGMAAAGQDAYAITVKKAGGKVQFASAPAAGVSANALERGAVDAAALQSFLADESHSIARISCFRDGVAARAKLEELGLKNTGGYVFYDGNGENWMDPAKPAARQYLCDLAIECAQLGFDEILLTDFGYPTEGKLDKISYGEQLRTENLKVFLDEMNAALEPYEVMLSVELPAADVLAGNNAVAGWLLSDVAPRLNRIYAPCEAAQIAELEQAVEAAGQETAFVPELTQLPDGEGSYLLLSSE